MEYSCSTQEQGRTCTEQYFIASKPCITVKVGAAMRDNNYVAGAFSLTKVTYRYASVRLPA